MYKLKRALVKLKKDRSGLAALRIIGPYILIGSLWILFSDNILHFMVKDAHLMNILSIFKGWFYVLITAALGFIMMKKGFKRIQNAENEALRRLKNLRTAYIQLEEANNKIAESELELKKIAYYDSVTGLPNNRLFDMHLSRQLVSASLEETGIIAVFVLDLDNFRTINDTFGQMTGNVLLKNIGTELNNSFSDNAFVSHTKSGEYVISFHGIRDKKNIEEIIEKVKSIFRKPWECGNFELYVTVSVGIAVFPDHGTDADTLVRNAYLATYKAKEHGRDNHFIYRKSISELIKYRIELDRALRKAIENREFLVYYQPQLDLETKRVFGVEALVRWNHPERGIVTPGEFIPFAEETGLIVAIDEFVLREACRQVKEWNDRIDQPVKLSVNLSAYQFHNENLMEKITGILSQTGLDSKYIELEITESMAMKNINFAMYMLNELKSKGIRISLDDFGTGYSSLNYLKKLPIDTLKIDSTFISDINKDVRKQAILESIINLAVNFNLQVIAEGIETREQLEYLMDHKCSRFQGYLFSMPIPAGAMFDMLKSEQQVYKL